MTKNKTKSQSSDVDELIRSLTREFDRVLKGGKFDADKSLEIFKNPALVNMLRIGKHFRDLHVAPGGLSFLRFERALVNRRLDARLGQEFGTIIDGLFNALAHVVDDDDDRARKQIEVIKRFAWPDLYSIQLTDIENILKSSQTSASRARALELMEIMGRLSYVVEARNKRDRNKNIVHNQTPIQIKSSLDDHDRNHCGPGLLAIAAKHLKRNATLQMLAIRVSGFARDELRQKRQIDDDDATIQDEVTNISVRTLKDDLKSLSIVRSSPYDDYGSGIVTQPFSTEWKQARKGRHPSLKEKTSIRNV